MRSALPTQSPFQSSSQWGLYAALTCLWHVSSFLLDVSPPFSITWFLSSTLFLFCLFVSPSLFSFHFHSSRFCSQMSHSSQFSSSSETQDLTQMGLLINSRLPVTHFSLEREMNACTANSTAVLPALETQAAQKTQSCFRRAEHFLKLEYMMLYFISTSCLVLHRILEHESCEAPVLTGQWVSLKEQWCDSYQRKTVNTGCYIHKTVQFSHLYFFRAYSFIPSVLFFLSPRPPRSYCTSCPFSPRRMISTSCSSISGARRAWRMKKEPSNHPLSDSAHAVSGPLALNPTVTNTQSYTERRDHLMSLYWAVGTSLSIQHCFLTLISSFKQQIVTIWPIAVVNT